MILETENPAPPISEVEKSNPVPIAPLTEREWKRVLRGEPYRVLVKPEQLEWAEERGLAVRCINCARAPGETHDPWWAWCLATRTCVSNTWPKLCPRFERRP